MSDARLFQSDDVAGRSESGCLVKSRETLLDGMETLHGNMATDTNMMCQRIGTKPVAQRRQNGPFL